MSFIVFPHHPTSSVRLIITLHTIMEPIGRIQYQAALFITGTWKGTNRNKLYDELV